MEYIYSYNKEDVKFLDHLHTYLSEISTIPTDFYINATSQIDIVFTQELSNEQLIILNNAIDDYIPPQELYIPLRNETILNNAVISSIAYSVIGTYYFSSLDNDTFITSFTIVSCVKGAISYKIRIYDSINNKIICETDSLNNTNLQIVKLDNLSNIPLNDTLFEIQGIISDNSNTCDVKLIQINFSKKLN